MAIDLAAALDGERAFPVTPWDSLEAGLTVMAIDRAMESRRGRRLRADVGRLRRGPRRAGAGPASVTA